MKLHLMIAGLFFVAAPLLAAQTNAPSIFPATLSSDFLVSNRFYAVSDLWQMSPPERDDVVFHTDGRVENKHAGLSSRWRLADAKTIEITSSLPGGHAVGLALDSERTSLFWPIREGAQTGTRIYLLSPESSTQPSAPANAATPRR